MNWMDNIMAWTEKRLEDIHRNARRREMPTRGQWQITESKYVYKVWRGHHLWRECAVNL